MFRMLSDAVICHDMFREAVVPDWYCDEVLPGLTPVEVVAEDQQTLTFRPPIPGFGTDHMIVIPKRHVESLLELEPADFTPVLVAVQGAARLLTELHGGCQVISSCGNEQHNRHMHWHVAVGEGVARFTAR